MTPISDRGADRIATALLLLVAIVGLAGVILSVDAWGDLKAADAFPNLVSALAGGIYAALGALIVRRARNIIGWILEGVGLGMVFITLTSAYAVEGLLTHPGALPGAKWVGAVSDPIFAATAISLGYMLFVFPTGTLPTRRWRPIVRVGVGAAALSVIGLTLLPAEEALPAPGGVSLLYPNPLRIEPSGGALSTALVVAVWIVVLTTVAAFLSLVIRYRSAGSEQRQQIKWIAFAAASALALNLGAVLTLVVCGCDQSPVAAALLLVEAFVVLIGVPAVLTIAILKHRLYEIDVIINRAVVYGFLAALVTIVYASVVAGVGAIVGRRGSPGLTITAAVVIALLFQPARQWARRFANRIVYGNRATPYQVLSEFAERMGGTFALDDVLQRMASVLAAGTGATRADVWLVIESELRSVTAWPADAVQANPIALGPDDRLPPFDASRVVGVRHGDQLLGAISISKPKNEPLTPTEEKLLEDLASQAGLVLRNVGLTAELQANIEALRASRRRLVEAQDQERRKIERNLHDGAQQQLVALSVQLGLLERLADDPTRVRETTSRLQAAVQDALDDLRDLARGVYPPVLADQGLAAALEAQARKAAVPTRVEADGIARYPQDMEAAVYFSVLEALQNVAKYADATRAVIRLDEREQNLVFEIEDDGRGFDVAETTFGTGVRGMTDRLEAIGGTLRVQSERGKGTLVRGSIPVGSSAGS
jgi:signal transduction histidine kinase